MAEWPLKHDGSCACRFVRSEEFGDVEQHEWCGLHATQRHEIARLRKVMQQVLVDAEAQDVLPEWHTVMREALVSNKQGEPGAAKDD